LSKNKPQATEKQFIVHNGIRLLQKPVKSKFLHFFCHFIEIGAKVFPKAFLCAYSHSHMYCHKLTALNRWDFSFFFQKIKIIIST